MEIKLVIKYCVAQSQGFITNRCEGQERSEKRKRENNKETEDNHGEMTYEEKEDE